MRRNWSFSTFQHYIGYSSHYIHTCILHRGKKGKTDIGNTTLIQRDSTTATLVLIRPRNTATPMNTIDINNENMNGMWEPATGIEPGYSA